MAHILVFKRDRDGKLWILFNRREAFESTDASWGPPGGCGFRDLDQSNPVESLLGFLRRRAGGERPGVLPRCLEETDERETRILRLSDSMFYVTILLPGDFEDWAPSGRGDHAEVILGPDPKQKKFENGLHVEDAFMWYPYREKFEQCMYISNVLKHTPYKVCYWMREVLCDPIVMDHLKIIEESLRLARELKDITIAIPKIKLTVGPSSPLEPPPNELLSPQLPLPPCLPLTPVGSPPGGMDPPEVLPQEGAYQLPALVSELLSRNYEDIGIENIEDIFFQCWPSWDSEYRKKLLRAVKLLQCDLILALLKIGNGVGDGIDQIQIVLKPRHVSTVSPHIQQSNFHEFGLERILARGMWTSDFDFDLESFLVFEGPAKSRTLVVEWPFHNNRATYIFQYEEGQKRTFLDRVVAFGVQFHHYPRMALKQNMPFQQLLKSIKTAKARDSFTSTLRDAFQESDDHEPGVYGVANYTGYLCVLLHNSTYAARMNNFMLKWAPTLRIDHPFELCGSNPKRRSTHKNPVTCVSEVVSMSSLIYPILDHYSDSESSGGEASHLHVQIRNMLNELDQLKHQNKELKHESDELKATNESLKAEMMTCKTTDETLKADNERLKAENERFRACLRTLAVNANLLLNDANIPEKSCGEGKM